MAMFLENKINVRRKRREQSRMDTCNIGYREQRQSKHRKLKRGKRQILPKNRG
jgi:hypothetical protein